MGGKGHWKDDCWEIQRAAGSGVSVNCGKTGVLGHECNGGTVPSAQGWLQ